MQLFVKEKVLLKIRALDVLGKLDDTCTIIKSHGILDAPSHLFKRSGPSVGPSVDPSVCPSVTPSVSPSVSP